MWGFSRKSRTVSKERIEVADVAETTVQFVDAVVHHDIEARLERLLADGSRRTAGAVCYFTKAGFELIARSEVRENFLKDGGFIVIGGAFPTDLEAVLALDRFLRGRVYLHWGGTDPIATDTARYPSFRHPLMHSKVFVADGPERTAVWTGSHNLTASAIKGANIEAATIVSGKSDQAWSRDARAHVEACRDESELFDRDKMEEYRRRQGKPGDDPEEIRRRKCLVIHARGELPTEHSFRIHVKVCTDRFDRSFANDMPVRLFVHPNELMNQESCFDLDLAKCWAGCVTGVNRGNDHATNPGITGDYGSADYEIVVLDGSSEPSIARGEQSTPERSIQTQVTARLFREREIGKEVFSTSPMSRTVGLIPRQSVIKTGIRLGRFSKFFKAKNESPPEELTISLVESSRRSFTISGDDGITGDLLNRFKSRSKTQGLELEIDTSASDPESNGHLFYVAKSYISLVDSDEDDCRGSKRPR